MALAGKRAAVIQRRAASGAGSAARAAAWRMLDPVERRPEAERRPIARLDLDDLAVAAATPAGTAG